MSKPKHEKIPTFRINYRQKPDNSHRDYFNSDFTRDHGGFEKCVGDTFTNCKFAGKSFVEANGIRAINCQFETESFYNAKGIHIEHSIFPNDAFQSATHIYLRDCKFEEQGGQQISGTLSSARAVLLELCTFPYDAGKHSSSVSARGCQFGNYAFNHTRGITAESCVFGNYCIKDVEDVQLNNCQFNDEGLQGIKHAIISGTFASGRGTFWNSNNVYVFSEHGEVDELFRPKQGIVVLRSIEKIGKDGSPHLNYDNPHIYVTYGNAPPGVRKLASDDLGHIKNCIRRNFNVKNGLEEAIRELGG